MTFSRTIVTAGLALGCFVTTFPTAAATADAQTVARGAVVSSTLVEKLDKDQVAERLKATGIDAAQVKYGVRAYRVVYRTVDAKGRSTTASQLVALPHNTRRNLQVVSWLHGTTVYRGDVASVNAKSTDRASALLFAGAGHAVSAPDYLGLGTGPGHHTYGDPRTTVSAPVDALRATRTVAKGHQRRLDPRVLVSGFSQGGPATMMVGRFLQQGQDPYFKLGGLAPIAGPFNLSSFEAAAADDKIRMSSLYLAYFIVSADRYTDIYGTPSKVFRAPYDKQVEKLFDGNHQAAEIAQALPPESAKLFTAQFLDRVRKPTGNLKKLLTALDSTCNWKPEVPVRLHHAKGDVDVAYDNALYCQSQLRSHGATQTLTDAGDVDHNQTVRKALPLVVAGFTRNRA
ncbi:lipase family protein [Nonomuraea glycinis]|uniref:Alpha/beta hydrolase n=1 Tax=Nonomuraea glycinis TaxID=2047744 RepID=A0A918ADC1_9ACTN|nr:lipase family protein [Nonomuraea glycinis]MCA2181004.1 lipase family protein [Nonomuraea glycinis]GGP13197.1 hypothetical protein GCM10012278_64020 [Nonomuraea glycinis]